MLCRATQDGRIMVESSDKMWPAGEGNGKPLQYSCLENPMNSMKRQKDRTLKDELPRSVGAQYAIGDQWRNKSRKNKEMEPKQKQHPVVDVTGDGSKVQCCKEQYCIGTWNVRSMNQCKLEVIEQEMARVKRWLWSMWLDWLVFCDCGFQTALWWRRVRGLWKLPDGIDWLRGKLGLVLVLGIWFQLWNQIIFVCT